ncbi:unnamed protein product [Schistocephalus solidus]|uniref:Dual specificity protein phosphatase 14 n=1 Tax=Schistocephalus solidus TaxID=70667 RepID=A0A0X3PLR1_SCHSO|nr:unnamed protein product [Schistocephalus solidus]
MTGSTYYTACLHDRNWVSGGTTYTPRSPLNIFAFSRQPNSGVIRNISSSPYSSGLRLRPLPAFTASSCSLHRAERQRTGRLPTRTVSWPDMFSQIARINDHLYLSGLQALNPERLRQYGITQVITAMIDPPPASLLSAVTSHIQISVEDAETSNLRIYFDSVGERIAMEKKRGGKTLVHCMAGISRSASLVLAYLIRHQNMSLADAYDLVRAVRPFIQPNAGFWRQLISYEELVRGRRSMRILSDSTSQLTVPSVGWRNEYSSRCYRTPSTYTQEKPGIPSRYAAGAYRGIYEDSLRVSNVNGVYGRY